MYEHCFIHCTTTAQMQAAESNAETFAIGSEANFMFEWLRPYPESTLDEVRNSLIRPWLAAYNAWLQPHPDSTMDEVRAELAEMAPTPHR